MQSILKSFFRFPCFSTKENPTRQTRRTVSAKGVTQDYYTCQVTRMLRPGPLPHVSQRELLNAVTVSRRLYDATRKLFRLVVRGCPTGCAADDAATGKLFLHCQMSSFGVEVCDARCSSLLISTIPIEVAPQNATMDETLSAWSHHLSLHGSLDGLECR